MRFTRKFNKKRTRNKKMYKKRTSNKFTRNKNKKYGGVGSNDTGATFGPDEISEIHLSEIPRTRSPTGSTIQHLYMNKEPIRTLKDLIKNSIESKERPNRVIDTAKLVFNPNDMQRYIKSIIHYDRIRTNTNLLDDSLRINNYKLYINKFNLNLPSIYKKYFGVYIYVANSIFESLKFIYDQYQVDNEIKRYIYLLLLNIYQFIRHESVINNTGYKIYYRNIREEFENIYKLVNNMYYNEEYYDELHEIYRDLLHVVIPQVMDIDDIVYKNNRSDNSILLNISLLLTIDNLNNKYLQESNEYLENEDKKADVLLLVHIYYVIMEQMHILMEYFIETKITDKLPSVIEDENREKKEIIMKKIEYAIKNKLFHMQPHIQAKAKDALLYETTRVPTFNDLTLRDRLKRTAPTGFTGNDGPRPGESNRSRLVNQ